MPDIVFLYCTAPDAATAETIANALIAERLAACVNILAPAQSIYEWQGSVEKTEETPFIVKTTTAAAQGVRERILALHPYDCPCVVALQIGSAHSSAAFLDWIKKQTGPA